MTDRISLTWIVLGDLSPSRGTVVRVFTGEGAGDRADHFARLRRDRDLIYRPASEPTPSEGSRIARESWSGSPQGAESGPRAEPDESASTAADQRAIRDLARQDQSGDVDDSYARTGDAENTIQRWYDSASQAGDEKLVEIVDRLGVEAAARIYEAARRR